MIGPLDTTSLDKAWHEYKEARKSGGLTDWGLINLTSWMGERMGHVLQEIQMLRAQVESLQKTLKEEMAQAEAATFDYMFDEEW